MREAARFYAKQASFSIRLFLSRHFASALAARLGGRRGALHTRPRFGQVLSPVLSPRARFAVVNPRQRASAARSEVPPEAGELRGSAGERPCSSPTRATRAFPRRRRVVGDAAGVAGWRQNRSAAARDGKANGAGGFARRRERGEGVSRSRTRRGASGARRGRGGLRAERHTRERRERKHASLAERACGGMACPHAHAGPKGSHALRARGSCPAAVRGLRTASARGGGGAGACLSAAKGAERRTPTAARSLIARGGGQGWIGDADSRGQAKDERGFPPTRIAPDFWGRMRRACCGWEFVPHSAGRRHVARSGRRCAGGRLVSR